MIKDLTTLYKKNREKLIKKVGRLNHYGPDTEDIVQTAFCKALSSLHTYDEKKASLSTWLNSILIREVWNSFRKKNREPPFLDVLECVIEDTNSMQEELTFKNLLAKVDNPLHKEVLVAKIVYGYTYKELSSMLTIPQSSARAVIREFKKGI